MKSIKRKYKNLVEIFANGVLIHKFRKNLDLVHKNCYTVYSCQIDSTITRRVIHSYLAIFTLHDYTVLKCPSLIS